jgi:uncharacterized membrane protein
MTFLKHLRLYLIALAVAFPVDMLWLGVVAKDFYRSHLDHLLAEEVYWPAAAVFYATYIAGLQIFAVIPGLRAASLRKTVLNATGFGLFTYMTYDLTNMATLPDWPATLAAVDIAWGMIFSACVAALVYVIGRRLPRT